MAQESPFSLTNYYGQKLVRDSKEDSGPFFGLLSSSGSPRIGFSRSSSGLSFLDDMNDCDFSCPFDVDDGDTSNFLAKCFALLLLPQFECILYVIASFYEAANPIIVRYPHWI
ncbi:hypothetical protein SLA2020_045490 [Shorea laevis]